MATRTIEQLPIINHEDVPPLYSKEEILGKLATAVSYHREVAKDGRGWDANTSQQRLELELLYSMAKAFL